ncbi:XrtX-associated membrane protein [Rufibacter roseolus]|uniref:XrtX-associated membrane protein n=1 Tax=Rufibacter roseolus TaxID=2817375 RepID=UPI001B3160E1|nr:hypothetical protein [Rufibacter roseolus]
MDKTQTNNLPPLKKLYLPFALGLALLILGTAVDFLFDQMEVVYRSIFSFLGTPSLYDQLAKKAFDVKVLTLILLNAFFCFLILWTIFTDKAKRKIIIYLSAGIFFLPLFFALIVKLTGDDPGLRMRSRAIIDYILLTPFSILFITPLLVLFKVSPPEKAETQLY